MLIYTALGVAAIVVGIISYLPYYRDIFLLKTKPHAFSWFGWAFFSGIVFFAQLTSGAGAGAWVTGATAVLCLSIFLLSLKYGTTDRTNIDWFALTASFVAAGLWYVTHDPLWSVVLVTLATTFSFIPTFRKSFYNPRQETLSTYVLTMVKFALGILALQDFSITNWLFPAASILTHGLFVGMVLWRRR